MRGWRVHSYLAHTSGTSYNSFFFGDFSALECPPFVSDTCTLMPEGPEVLSAAWVLTHRLLGCRVARASVLVGSRYAEARPTGWGGLRKLGIQLGGGESDRNVNNAAVAAALPQLDGVYCHGKLLVLGVGQGTGHIWSTLGLAGYWATEPPTQPQMPPPLPPPPQSRPQLSASADTIASPQRHHARARFDLVGSDGRDRGCLTYYDKLQYGTMKVVGLEEEGREGDEVQTTAASETHARFLKLGPSWLPPRTPPGVGEQWVEQHLDDAADAKSSNNTSRSIHAGGSRSKSKRANGSGSKSRAMPDLLTKETFVGIARAAGDIFPTQFRSVPPFWVLLVLAL